MTALIPWFKNPSAGGTGLFGSLRHSGVFFILSALILASCGGSAEKPVPVHLLPAPSNLATVSEAGKVVLRWNGVPGADSYNVYWGTGAGVRPATAQKIGGVKGASFEHKGLKNQTVYFYVVTAVNGTGESPPSAEVGGMPRGTSPAQPVGVTATVAGDGTVKVVWQPVPGAASYRVYHAEKPGAALKEGRAETASAASFVHTGLKSGGHHFYAVAAVNDSGEGPASAESGVLMKILPPGPPHNVAVAAYPDKIELKWDAVNGARSYNVYISKTGAFDGAKAKKVNVESNGYGHTGLKKGDRYFYRVTAVNGSGESPASGTVGAKI